MTSQIFKRPIPNEIVFEFLDSICLKNEQYYTYNFDSFKCGMYKGLIQEFKDKCSPFYYIAKRRYLARKSTHTNFTTILRQICNFNKIKYTSQIKYDRSEYDIIYYFYYDNS